MLRIKLPGKTSYRFCDFYEPIEEICKTDDSELMENAITQIRGRLDDYVNNAVRYEWAPDSGGLLTVINVYDGQNSDTIIKHAEDYANHVFDWAKIEFGGEMNEAVRV